MLKPTARQIEEMAAEYPVIPICRELYADVITPIALLRRLAAASSRYYLLESVEGGERWGRYSFLGFDPIKRVTCKSGVVTVEEEGGARRVETRRPLPGAAGAAPGIPLSPSAGDAALHRRAGRFLFL